MRSLALEEISPPPLGRLGWPWTDASRSLAEAAPSGASWPRISIITPSYNQGQFIEETIRSVLLQGYPNLEYIVIDGGSTDDSVAIIKKYEVSLSYWVSEQDRGQSHAINKGFHRATGDILAWLNSDDVYLPGVLEHIALSYLRSTPERFWLVTGIEHFQQGDGAVEIHKQAPFASFADWVPGNAQLNQQGTFWSSVIHKNVGPLDESMHYGFDKEYFVRLLSRGYRFECAEDFVGARFRFHNASKTVTDFKGDAPVFQYEWAQIFLRYLPKDSPDYEQERRRIKESIAYFKVRFSQDTRKSRWARILDLAAAVGFAPSLVWKKSFLGSLKRILIP